MPHFAQNRPLYLTYCPGIIINTAPFYSQRCLHLNNFSESMEGVGSGGGGPY